MIIIFAVIDRRPSSGDYRVMRAFDTRAAAEAHIAAVASRMGGRMGLDVIEVELEQDGPRERPGERIEAAHRRMADATQACVRCGSTTMLGRGRLGVVLCATCS